MFEAAIFCDSVASADDVRNPAWYRRVAPLTTRDGIVPYTTYVVREKGKVELGNNACAFCHTRVLPDGMVVKGAQGNFPFDRAVGFSTRRGSLEEARVGFRTLFGAPWLKAEDPAARAETMSMEELAAKYEVIPGGVVARHRASADSTPAVPDLIGVKERRYLDRTGLVVHRDIGDLMRYAALNNELDFLSSFGDFVPAGRNFRELPDPTDPDLVGGGRYSDEQLYALTLYIYSLQPPPNPVWYRGPFEHNGSVATLEDWFDPRRLQDDYVPTGFVASGVKMRAVKGHEFGLRLSDEERKDLIAFLKTL